MTGWLNDYVALVTGGGSGIGRAVADRFVAEGASVTILGRSADQLSEVVDASPDPSRMHAVSADVRNSEQLHRAVAEAVERFGKLDTLVANAGIWDYHRQLTKMSADQLAASFDEVFAINVKGYLLAAEAAWRELVKTRGSIVMTLSNASFYVNGGGPVYRQQARMPGPDARAGLRAGTQGARQRGRLRRHEHRPARPGGTVDERQVPGGSLRQER